MTKCSICKIREIWEPVTGVCEPCYDELSIKSASIKTPAMSTALWNQIVGPAFQPIQRRKRKHKRVS